MGKMIVMEVNVCCQKCKQKLMRAVSSLQGIDLVNIDAASRILTVTGDADPIDVVCCARKAVGCAEVVSIGPLHPTKTNESRNKPQPEKKKEEKEEVPMAMAHVPSVCHVCMRFEDSEPSCYIM